MMRRYNRLLVLFFVVSDALISGSSFGLAYLLRFHWLSDVIPVTAQARSIVMIEQVAGLMYVALVISRIVGLTIARERGQGS